MIIATQNKLPSHCMERNHQDQQGRKTGLVEQEREHSPPQELILLFSSPDCASIRHLALECKEIGPIEVLAFSRATWSSLVKLDFAGNMIGSKGCKYLARVLMPSLKLADLSTNFIGDAGMLHLSKASWGSLKAIDLANNEICCAGVRFFVRANWMNLSILGTLYGKEVNSTILFESVNLVLAEFKLTNLIRIRMVKDFPSNFYQLSHIQRSRMIYEFKRIRRMPKESMMILENRFGGINKGSVKGVYESYIKEIGQQ